MSLFANADLVDMLLDQPMGRQRKATPSKLAIAAIRIYNRFQLMRGHTSVAPTRWLHKFSMALGKLGRSNQWPVQGTGRQSLKNLRDISNAQYAELGLTAHLNPHNHNVYRRLDDEAKNVR